MVKRSFLLVLAVVFIATGVWAGMFYWKNLRGIGPAVRPPAEVSAPTSTGEEAGQNPAGNTTGLPLELPRGFGMSTLARGLGAPRVIVQDPSGRLVVSATAGGNVFVLAPERKTLLSGLRKPHGVLFVEEGNAVKLYVAEEHAVSIYEYDAERITATNRKKIIDLPTDGGHFTRTLIRQGNRLLISVGSSCNVCLEEDWRRAKILSANLDGSDLKEYAKGLRNAVFMAEHPQTHDLWVTEMARDLLGDDIPPDEINIVKDPSTSSGQVANFGWPICYGKNIHDAQFDKNTYIRNPCMEPFETPSHIDLQAHSAPLGLAFIPDSWPSEYRDDLLVAFHGSWNRSVPTGYKVVRMKLDAEGNFQGQEDFITGWLTSRDQAIGRPVDLLFDGEGMLYISDDKSGTVYRVTPP